MIFWRSLGHRFCSFEVFALNGVYVLFMCNFWSVYFWRQFTNLTKLRCAPETISQIAPRRFGSGCYFWLAMMLWSSLPDRQPRPANTKICLGFASVLWKLTSQFYFILWSLQISLVNVCEYTEMKIPWGKLMFVLFLFLEIWLQSYSVRQVPPNLCFCFYFYFEIG